MSYEPLSQLDNNQRDSQITDSLLPDAVTNDITSQAARNYDIERGRYGVPSTSDLKRSGSDPSLYTTLRELYD
jgi:hypothetical protein